LLFIRRICARVRAVSPSIARRSHRVAAHLLGDGLVDARAPVSSRRRVDVRQRVRGRARCRPLAPRDALGRRRRERRDVARVVARHRRVAARRAGARASSGATRRRGMATAVGGARDALARALRELASVALDEDEIEYVLDGAIDVDGTCAPREEFVEFVWPVIAPWVDDDEARARALAGDARDGRRREGDDDGGRNAARRPRAGVPGRGLARGRRAGGRGAKGDGGGGGRRENVRREGWTRRRGRVEGGDAGPGESEAGGRALGGERGG
jgi:hypothetical protein